jgi:hypothetical protein
MTMTRGEMRVGMNYNPWKSECVDNMKRHAAEIIDLCLDYADASPNPEVMRLATTAALKYEEATLWAIKAITQNNALPPPAGFKGEEPDPVQRLHPPTSVIADLTAAIEKT